MSLRLGRGEEKWMSSVRLVTHNLRRAVRGRRRRVVLMIGASDITGFVVGRRRSTAPTTSHEGAFSRHESRHNSQSDKPIHWTVICHVLVLDDPASRCHPRPGIERRMGRRYLTHVFLNASTGRREYRPTPASRGLDKAILPPLPRR